MSAATTEVTRLGGPLARSIFTHPILPSSHSLNTTGSHSTISSECAGLQVGMDEYECEYCDRTFDTEEAAEEHEADCAAEFALLSGAQVRSRHCIPTEPVRG